MGIGLRLAAALCFTGMAGLVKGAEDLPVGQMLFARSIVFVPVVLAFLMWQGRLRELRTSRLPGHFLRTILGCTALVLWFVALRFLPLPDVTALLYLSPILNVILGAVLLGERVGLYRAGAVAAGVAGMLVIMAPRFSGAYDELALVGALCCICNAICFSLSLVQIRQLSTTEGTISIVFYFSAFSAALALLSLPFGWVWPTGTQWLYLAGIGVIGGAGQLFLTACYRFAPISLIAPFEYSTLIWAIIIGLLFFDEIPTAATLAGAALIVVAGIVVAYRENRLGLQRPGKDNPA